MPIDYRQEAPQLLLDFLSYHETIKAHSQRTVDEYFLDLRNFFRYLKQTRDPALRDVPMDQISIRDVDRDLIASVTLTDIYGYMTYLSRDRVLHQNSQRSEKGLNAASRARKLATIRSFYGYLCNKVHVLEENPVKDMDSPKLKKTLPRYLTLEESMALLDSVDGPNRERDYCILTLFLNCGLRISELIGLNRSAFKERPSTCWARATRSASSTSMRRVRWLWSSIWRCGDPSPAGTRTPCFSPSRTDASAAPWSMRW